MGEFQDAEDRLDYWWNDQTGQYELGTQFGPLENKPSMNYKMPEPPKPAKKKLLTDVDTRYNILGDLLEFLDDGLIAVTHSLTRYSNDTDAERKRKLEGAIVMVRSYQEKMSDMAAEKWKMNKLLDECVPPAAVLAEIRSTRIAARIEKMKPLEPSEEGGTAPVDGPDGVA